MAYINIDEVFILDNTGLQVDMATDIPFADAGFSDDQKAQARKNIAAGGTNPNLIDNPWFTIRQRGNGPFSALGFTVDRWQIGGGSPTVTPQTPYGVSISATAGYNLLQNLPYTVAEYGGKTMTLSAIVDGELYSTTFVYAAGVIAYVTFNGGNDLVRYDCTNAQVLFTHNIASASHNYTVTAVKLELGSVSTLANDTPPDYATELLKCQRYFIRIAPTAYTTLWSGVCINASTFAFNITTPVPMRYANPTITFTGTLDFVEQTTSGGSIRTVTGLTAYAPVSNSNNIRVLATTASTLGSNNLACIYTYAYTPVIDVSCDL